MCRPSRCIGGIVSRAHSRGTDTEWRRLREACFRVWGKTCMYCGDRATDVDHIIEIAAGGSNSIDNLQPLCKPCHMAKTVKFNSTKNNNFSKNISVFSERLPPTDSLSLFSPLMTRLDPPITERPKS